jgi:rhodanese-related sulfurtransferase
MLAGTKAKAFMLTDTLDGAAAACGPVTGADNAISVTRPARTSGRRTGGSVGLGCGRHFSVPQTVEELLAEARARLTRLAPADVASVIADGGLLVDTRPLELRQRDGVVPDAVIIDRNVLEWRLDPASADRIDAVTGHDQAIVVMCNEGYASSLVAAELQDMGFSKATDVDGGFQAWRAAGLPVTPAE